MRDIMDGSEEDTPASPPSACVVGRCGPLDRVRQARIWVVVAVDEGSAANVAFVGFNNETLLSVKCVAGV